MGWWQEPGSQPGIRLQGAQKDLHSGWWVGRRVVPGTGHAQLPSGVTASEPGSPGWTGLSWLRIRGSQGGWQGHMGKRGARAPEGGDAQPRCQTSGAPVSPGSKSPLACQLTDLPCRSWGAPRRWQGAFQDLAGRIESYLFQPLEPARVPWLAHGPASLRTRSAVASSHMATLMPTPSRALW